MADWGNRREIKSGSTGGSKFMALDLSEYEVEQFKLKQGNNRIEILPYEISTNMHPLVVAGKMKKGQLDYNVVLKVHTNVGPGKKSVVCPYPYGKPCPICEAAIAAKNAGDTKTNEALYAKTKVYYNIVDNSERDKGIKIFETSIKGFQKPLEVVDLNSEEDFPGKFFADIDNGLTVKVLGGEAEFGGHKYIEASSISFVERKEGVKQFVKDVIPLDKCIKLLSYDELEALMMGAGGDEEDEDETPTKKVSKPPIDDEDDEPPAKVKKPVEDEDKPPKSKADGECPEGLEWGFVYAGDSPKCEDCDPKLYSKCMKYGKANS
jgi:hypothetical protein